MTTKQEKPVLVNGKQIVNIIAHSAEVIVAVSITGGIVFEYHNTPPNPERLINKFHSIDSKLSRDLPAELFNKLQHELGSAIYAALLSESEIEGIECFNHIEEKIESVKDPEQAKAILVVLSLITSIILITALIVSYSCKLLNQEFIYLCMSAGVVGSLFSLLNRNKKIHLYLLGGGKYIFIQSLTISITGLISGFIIYIVSNSNIAFGFAKTDLFALLAICIIAGFSERLIPDLFGKIEDQS